MLHQHPHKNVHADLLCVYPYPESSILPVRLIFSPRLDVYSADILMSTPASDLILVNQLSSTVFCVICNAHTSVDSDSRCRRGVLHDIECDQLKHNLHKSSPRNGGC